ncbi:hypothetical protein F4821DRAFT_153219 [Hypoxylon rubiginosum]|uniref:Uncharacterized protein n=1 Tax=Hypoxylon rubiginosum TaxID=110542 RepID=A0ACC0CYX2_9PEZI|nr:hypothetical protein F4821DRAFT_153219 [Hypoxylon rubiginosum]
MDPPTKPSVIAQIWNQQQPVEVPSYFNEQKFFADIDTMQSAHAFAESLPMDFALLRTIFLTTPDDLFSIIDTPPDYELLGRLLGIDDTRETYHLIRAWLDEPTGVYVTQYLRGESIEDETVDPLELTLPHPATLYECLRETLGESVRYQVYAVRGATRWLPHDPIVRGVEFALKVRRILSSDECVARFPTLVNIRKMNLVGFTFLIVLLLILAQRCEEGLHNPECRECRNEGKYSIECLEMSAKNS